MLRVAAMTGRLAAGEPERVLALWEAQAAHVRAGTPGFRLLRCKARLEGCAAAFAAAAER